VTHLESNPPLERWQIERAFDAVLGLPPREDDIQLVQMLGGDAATLADYFWDHCLGEPERPSADEVLQAVEEAIR
jgi:hypothetical protein